jgi:hypothetical protein
MPPVEVNHIRHLNASVRLDEFTACSGRSVRRFHPHIRRRCCGQSAHLCLLEGRDFQYSPETPQAKQLFLHCVHVRGEHWRIGGACKEVCSRGGVHRFYAGIEGVILHSISRQSKNGASHRKNCDTPPLGGYTNVNARLHTSTLLH